MRKNTRNEKVLRAITIGLAAMITATSTPVTVFADDDPVISNPDGEQFGQGETTQPVETQTIEEATPIVENAQNIVTGPEYNEPVASEPEQQSSEPQSSQEEGSDPASQNETEQSGCIPAIENAINEVAGNEDEGIVGIPEANIAMPTPGVEGSEETTIVEDLNAAQKLLKGEGDEEGKVKQEDKGVWDFLEDAQMYFGKTQEAVDATINTEDSTYNTFVNSANVLLGEAEGKITEYDNVNKEDINKNADAAIGNASVANTSESEEDARKAAKNASDELKTASDGLKIATEAYNKAAEDAQLAQEQYDLAVLQLETAKTALKNANDSNENAKNKADEVEEKVKAAQAKVDELTAKVEKLEQKKNTLAEMQDQYYKAMVHFYRDTHILKYDDAVYKSDNTIDLEGSAKKAFENNKLVDTSNPKLDDNTMELCRELMKELVMYKLEADGIDIGTVEFAQEGKDTKTAAKGTLTTSKGGKEKVDIDKETEYEQLWDNVNGDSGRFNHVTVKYTVTDPDTNETKTVTEYYNYIYKASKYNDFNANDAEKAAEELKKGPIYLARIEPITNEAGETTGWTSARDDSENNLDNYQELLAALNSAIEERDKYNAELSEYEEAKQAVADAAKEVEKLQTELNNIKTVSVDFSTIERLKDRLDAAKQELENRKDEKEALEKKVQDARDAVESIDLSRFNKTTPPTVPEPEETPNEENKEEEQQEEEKKEEENLNAEEEQGETQEAEPVAEEVPEEKKEKKTPTPTTDTTDFTIPSGPSANTPSDEPSSDGTTATPDTTPEVTSSTTPAVIPGIIPEITPGGTPVELDTIFGGGTGFGPIAGGSGVAGVNLSRAADISGLFEDSNEFSEKLAKAQDTVKQVKAAEKKGQKTVKIEDQEVPLAAMPTEDGIHISWLWLLIILLLGEMGREMYKKHKERMEAAKVNAEADKTND